MLPRQGGAATEIRQRPLSRGIDLSPTCPGNVGRRGPRPPPPRPVAPPLAGRRQVSAFDATRRLAADRAAEGHAPMPTQPPRERTWRHWPGDWHERPTAAGVSWAGSAGNTMPPSPLHPNRDSQPVRMRNDAVVRARGWQRRGLSNGRRGGSGRSNFGRLLHRCGRGSAGSVGLGRWRFGRHGRTDRRSVGRRRLRIAKMPHDRKGQDQRASRIDGQD